jgi:RNA polymerase sigma-54 factor
MTQQMQQSIKLLQMSAMELEQLATTEMLENPFLEIAEEGVEEEENPDKQSAEDAETEEEEEEGEASHLKAALGR